MSWFQVEEAEVRVADSSGEKVDNKRRLDVIRQQEALIREEAAEKEEVCTYTYIHVFVHVCTCIRRINTNCTLIYQFSKERI